MIGRTLSHYQVLEKIGEGGMGEVYLAKDTKLDREVAVKVLPAAFSENKERLARFEREAKSVAALDHPNIVTIYSVEEAEGVHFYTMQLVKGKALSEMIPKGGLPLSKFFQVAIPLTDAVSAAHEQGIIHRDLKPDNLMVGDDGRLKILDFGLAKLKPEFSEAGASELPTQSATAEGRILGTVAYMSPEQAEGKTVDARSDICSVGIVLYEMATGERPFEGDTAASLLSSIIKDKPRSATEVNPSIPHELAKIIRRCLVKDPERRYQSAKDIRNELEELKQDIDSGEYIEGTTVGREKPKSKWILHTALVAAIVIAGIFAYQLRLGEVPDEATRPPIQGMLTQLTSRAGQELFPSLSPDGQFFIYSSPASGNWDIYLQRVGGERAINLTEDCLDDDTMPAYSADGKQIAFCSEREGGGIFLMGATGESVRRLSDVGYNPAWSPNGKEILYATELTAANPGARFTTSQLWAVNVSNGEKRLVSKADAVQPHWSPHGHRIAYWGLPVEGAQRDLWTIRPDGSDPVPVTNDGYVDWNPVWSHDGRHLYFSSDRGGSMNLWRVPIEEKTGQVLGEPSPVTTGGSASRHHLSLSRDGRRIAYVERVQTVNLQKVAFDPSTESVLGQPVPITRGSRRASAPDLSPDGEWLAFSSFGDTQEDISIIRTDGTDRRQLTDDSYKDRMPRWSPDGKRIAFYSDRSGTYRIWTIQPDGSGLDLLTEATGAANVYNPVWSPDGSRMAYWAELSHGSHICQLGEVPKEHTAEALASFDEAGEVFEVWSWSPDGNWLGGEIARGAGYSGCAIYNLESRQYQRLTHSGGAPVWLNDSRRLLLYESGKIFLVDRATERVRELLSISPDTVGSLSVPADNRSIYFDRRSSEADIWLLTFNEDRH
jgi:serine/threonine protein kinase/dipeptidyl aminopeptidase/acylaminoacyl peptidase